MRVSGEQISIGGNRWVVHGRAALTVMDELEVCELIGSVERELGRVHAVASRRAIVCIWLSARSTPADVLRRAGLHSHIRADPQTTALHNQRSYPEHMSAST